MWCYQMMMKGLVSSAQGNVITKLCANEPSLSQFQHWSTASGTHTSTSTTSQQLLTCYSHQLSFSTGDSHALGCTWSTAVFPGPLRINSTFYISRSLEVKAYVVLLVKYRWMVRRYPTACLGPREKREVPCPWGGCAAWSLKRACNMPSTIALRKI